MAAARGSGLREYRRKRRFDRTPEPSGASKPAKKAGAARFVVQKHDASRLHYDFRLEHDGVLKSWAVPKGPSLDPKQKRLAVEVEDHPLDYAGFEGTIPAGEYGGGTVLLWDRGRWYPEGDVDAALRKGHLRFRLAGRKLKGGWDLVRTSRDQGGKPSWLLFKRNDERAITSGDVLESAPESVSSGKRIEEIAAAPRRSWSSGRSSRAKGGGRAKKSVLPRFVEPELATLVEAPPSGDGWLHELKLDGYRIQAAVAGKNVRLSTRNRLDWTAKFPGVARALGTLGVESALLDGEIVALDERGRSSFQALQRALREGRAGELVYFAFDLLEWNGRKLGASTLAERKRQLQRLLGRRARPALRFGDHHRGDGDALFGSACAAGAEGIVSKRADSTYRPGRGRDWLKIKCATRQEVVIGGFTEPSGSRSHLGALLVGVHEGGELVYSGKVGTGFDEAALAALHRRLAPLVRQRPPFGNPPTGAEGRRATWVAPRLVAELSFTEWTRDGRLRHPVFLGLREDKPAAEVVRENPAVPTNKRAAAKATERSKAKPRSIGRASSRSAPKARTEAGAGDPAIVLSHPDRVLYPDVGVTKQELADYYASIAERMLPHLAGRLLTLVRCPQGIERSCFYQKHVGDEAPDAISSVEVREADGGVELYHHVDDLAGLHALVQMSVLEIHGWMATADAVERPDRIVFDLDPDAALPWKAVVEGAREVRTRLADAGLESWPLATGGKGLHVVAPLVRRRGWDDVREFARGVAVAMSADRPERYLSRASKSERKGRIFVDWLRNGRGASAILPFSTRARAGAPVATPLAWDEIARFRASSSTVRTLPRRLARARVDPWEEFWKVRQSVPAGAGKRARTAS